MPFNTKAREHRPPAALLAWCAAALLAGCTLGPDYKRPDVPLPPAWRAEMLDAADLANTEWWHAFGDADLDALIETAIANNKDLVLATLRIEQFAARLQISDAASYPQVTYSAAGQRERRSQERPNGLSPGASPSLSNYELSSTVTWELDLWGRVRRANEAARAELLATQEARRGVMLTVVSGVATSYVMLVDLDRRLLLAQQRLKNRKDALDLLEKKYLGGSTTKLVVEQMRAVVEADAAEIPPLERDIATLENALSGLLGQNASAIKRQKIDTLALPQMPLGVPADILARRPDVMAAEQNLVAANARIGVAKTEYFPVVSLNAILGLGADDLRWLFTETARTGNYGAGLTGPIFSGGRIEGDIKEAEALQKQAVVRFQQSVQQALLEVETALVGRTKAGQREQSLGRQVDLLRGVADLTRQRYEGGQSTLVDVLDAEQHVYTAQAEQAQSRRDTLLALISVYKAMGGGWMVEREKRLAPEAPPAEEVQAHAAAAIEAQE